MQRIITVAIIFANLFAAVPAGVAQDAAPRFAPLGDETENYLVETVLGGLDGPAGLVLRAGSAKAGPHELLIAEGNAGRVVQISTEQPQEVSEVLTGLSQSSFWEDSQQRFRPVGLALLTRSKLVVGGGGQAGVVGTYHLPDEGGVVSAGEPDHTVGPIHTGEGSDSVRVFFGIAKTDAALFLTWADANEGWILKSGIEANRLAYLQPFVVPRKTDGLGAPTGIAISPRSRPHFLVVSHLGRVATPHDSTIAFYVPTGATLVMHLSTGLHDIVALAYSPSGQLYAVDYAREEEAARGIYRLDDARVGGQQACRAVKIASISRPTALCFSPEGSLYVTALGADENAKQGVLVKITGNL